MPRDPYGESDVARKFNQKKPKPQEGDPKVAAAYMRKFGMGNLADFYEEQGGQAENGQVPSMFGGMMDNKGNLTGIKPPAGFGNLGSMMNNIAIQSAEGKAQVQKQSKPKNNATVGNATNPYEYPQAQNYGSRTGPAGGPTAQDFINAAPEAMRVDPDEQPDNSALPLANELELFATYSNIFSFGCLSPDEVNYPDDTYIKNGLKDGQLVFRSGKGLTAPRKPRTAAEVRYNIDTQYFINNVEIDTWIAPNKKSRQTNFHQIKFEVREPYSMGMLLQTMQLAADNAGYKNYLEAPWLLEMMFIGWKDIEKSNPSAPITRRLLPLKVVTVEFNVDAEGAVYQFLCSAFNDEAFADNAQSIPTDIQVSGRTLEEICQSGINSIATHINTHKIKSQLKDDKGKTISLKEAGKIEVDEYIIAFPSKRASKDQAALYRSNKEGRDTATTGELQYKTFSADETLEIVESGDVALSTLFNESGRKYASEFARRKLIEGRLGFSVKRGNLSESIKTVITDKSMGINPIGLSDIAPEEPTGAGHPDFGKPTFSYDAKSETFKRGAIAIDPAKRTVQFRAGTKIQRILEELVLISSYGQRLLKAEQDQNGMIDWFKIESQMYLIHDSKAEAKNGRMPRIYVYNVVPYKAHISAFQKPNAPPPGYDKLVKQAAKAYNYMYTGQNKDILDFEIKLDNTFFSAINKLGKKENDDTASKATDTPPSKVDESSGADGIPGNDGGRKSQQEVAQNTTPLSAGAVAESAEIQVARAFNEAIVNSEADLITLNMRILGDPYYIADSGMGNFNSHSTEYINVNANGSIDHQSGQVDVIINFETPIDIDPERGDYKMQAMPLSKVNNFSGLYQVITVANRIENNTFTQELSMVKRPNFEKKNVAEKTKEKAFEYSEVQQKQLDTIIAVKGKESEEYIVQKLIIQGKLDNISIAQEGINWGKVSDIQKSIAKILSADQTAREKANAQNKASDDRLIALAKSRSTANPTGNPVAVPPGQQTRGSDSAFANDAQATDPVVSTGTGQGYIDKNGLWVPYGID